MYARQLLHELIDQTVAFYRSQIPPGQPDEPQKIAELIEQAIDDQIASPFEQARMFSEFQDFELGEFDELGYAGIPPIIQNVIAIGIPLNQTTLIPKIKALLFRRLKEVGADSFYSGVIFVGFGEKEIFPALVATNISLSINNRLRYMEDKGGSAEITHQRASIIRPFAQHDVIDTILAGRDPGLAKLYLEQFNSFINKNNIAIANLVRQSDLALADKIAGIDSTALTEKLNGIILQETQKRYIHPMMRAITTLSKEDLSEMAESLIYLTYLKRRFTFSEESVGGPVDVAIITKTDGFIWVKRKHYFDITLNQHFLTNYQ